MLSSIQNNMTSLA